MGFFSSNVGRVSGVAAVVAPAVLALNAAGVWPALDDALFDTFTVFCAPSAREPGAVAVVGIDEPSFAEVGQRWPWPRALHARLVDELSRAGASVIAFDILFSEPLSSGDDVELARAIRDSGRVVLAGDVDIQQNASFESVQRVEPAPAFRAAGAVTGFANIEVGGDQVVRRFPQDPEAMWRVVIAQHEARQGLAPDAARRPAPGAMLRYSDGSDVRYVSYYQALEASKALPPDALRGRIVLVEVKVSLADFRGDYRKAFGYLDRFQQALTQQGYTVSAQKLPMDISSRGSISRDARSNDGAPAQFTLKIIWRRKE